MSCLTEISAANSGVSEVLTNIDKNLSESCSLRLALPPSATSVCCGGILASVQ